MWQADFGAFRVGGQRLYLLLILDDSSGLIVGHSLGDSLKTEVVVRTLSESISRHGKPKALGTDRGSAFVSKKLVHYLEDEGIEHIVSQRFDPQSAGKAESLIGAVRRELWDVEELAMPAAARRLKSLLEHSGKGRGIKKGRRFRRGVKSN